MALISREEVLEYLDKRRTYELMDCRNKAYGKGIRDAIKDIEALPSVPAVPLDKLCKFLEKCGADSYCGTCKQIMGGCFTNGHGCGSAHFWKELLTEWMEEQNATD